MHTKVLWKIESIWKEYFHINGKDFFDFSQSSEIVFSDAYGEYNGLLNAFQCIELDGKKVYLFDNHNRMLQVLFNAYHTSKEPLRIVHIDAHPDDASFEGVKPTSFDQQDLDYLLTTTRISDFFDALSETKVIASLSRITTSTAFQGYEEVPYDVLSLDIDIFGEEGDFVDLETKVRVIAQAWKSSKVVAIATSPGFINQQYAQDIISIMVR